MVRDDGYGERGKRFAEYLLDGIPALRKAGYNPYEFQRMVSTSGGVTTAKQLLAQGKPSTGLTTLWMKEMLDSSVEFAVCLPWFRDHLFTYEEIEQAEFRLTERGFDLARIHAVPVPDWCAAPTPEPTPEPPAAPTYRQRVEAEEAAQLARPATSTALTTEAVRSAVFRSLVLERAGGRCENPGCGHPGFHVIGRNDMPVVEVDHVHGLGEGGLDHPANMVVLCPNCHAVKTRGRDAEVAELQKLLAGIARQRHEAAMTGA
nr:hypothetical protein KPHV_61540 [Kitasatospora purpeofusca]